MHHRVVVALVRLLFMLATITACNSAKTENPNTKYNSTGDQHLDKKDDSVPALPEFSALELGERKLKVVATTNIIADVVANIGGDAIELTALMAVNQDPHSYEATPGDLIALEEADIIFVNGWQLEEQLAKTIEENFSDQYVAISAGIEPRRLGKGVSKSSDFQAHIDPHVWLSIRNVKQWAKNIETIFLQLDPGNGSTFTGNLIDYLAQLEALEKEVAEILSRLPEEQRRLVTNHDALGYFAAEYGFTLIGTIVPSLSTNAEPAAGDLAGLIKQMEEADVCTIFSDTMTNNALAETIAAELQHCRSVQVLPLHTGSLGENGADTYLGMFRSNVKTIVQGLEKELP